MLTCAQDGYLANERVVGMLDGRQGTFVLQHGAVVGSGFGEEGRLFGYVVPGSGSGALAGLAGTATVTHGLLALHYQTDRSDSGLEPVRARPEPFD